MEFSQAWPGHRFVEVGSKDDRSGDFCGSWRAEPDQRRSVAPAALAPEDQLLRGRRGHRVRPQRALRHARDRHDGRPLHGHGRADGVRPLSQARGPRCIDARALVSAPRVACSERTPCFSIRAGVRGTSGRLGSAWGGPGSRPPHGEARIQATSAAIATRLVRLAGASAPCRALLCRRPVGGGADLRVPAAAIERSRARARGPIASGQVVEPALASSARVASACGSYIRSRPSSMRPTSVKFLGRPSAGHGSRRSRR